MSAFNTVKSTWSMHHGAAMHAHAGPPCTGTQGFVHHAMGES
eukprot:CAMPEP_0202872476 /NCGR_PEP_ID=MMETSP1391-20130828/21292_1 /ASSEMBLY_ACC=CAM_ASM_000867 /TAXON_ID=1034604 /ORGANISM="Chlamydomonas leiostraca, Strain SAG 11-49" /LENGTH=41 /DNA_ID= /DNA_START= /DNA_END= /DNA_ORIENTATION=